jgi:hypothetical protein
MALNLKDLVAQGAFVSASEPHVKREIKWHNTEGEELTADVWVRRASYHTITNTWKAAEGNQEHLAARIATMICDEEGGPIFTTGDVLGTADPSRGPICDTLFLALITAVNEVQSAKTNPPKTSGSN